MRGYETGTHSWDWRASAGKRDVGCRLTTHLAGAMKLRVSVKSPADGHVSLPWGQERDPPPWREGVDGAVSAISAKRDDRIETRLDFTTSARCTPFRSAPVPFGWLARPLARDWKRWLERRRGRAAHGMPRPCGQRSLGLWKVVLSRGRFASAAFRAARSPHRCRAAGEGCLPPRPATGHDCTLASDGETGRRSVPLPGRRSTVDGERLPQCHQEGRVPGKALEAMGYSVGRTTARMRLVRPRCSAHATRRPSSERPTGIAAARATSIVVPRWTSKA